MRERKSIAYSQVGEEYPTYRMWNVGKLDLSHLAQELPSNTCY
jgi:hypothetical protein